MRYIITRNSVAGNGLNVLYNLGKNISSFYIENPSYEGWLDLDSHAYTCALGRHFQVFEDTGEICMVTPYSRDYEQVTLLILHVKIYGNCWVITLFSPW